MPEHALRARLLDAVHGIQALCNDEADPPALFDRMLSDLLELTGSAFGFVGEVLEPGTPTTRLRFLALSDISWSDETRSLYATSKSRGLEFTKLDTLYGVVLRSGDPIIANDPAHDTRRGGLPHGHPPLTAFCGLPLHRGSAFVGMIGLGNRPGGYEEHRIETLAPYLTTCAGIVHAFQTERERHRAEEERRKLEQQLLQVQKLESLGVLAGGIAHDFNNLLTGILGNANLAKYDVPEGTETYESLEYIERAAHRAADLCRQLLAYSGRGRLQVEPLDLSALVVDMVELLEVSLSKKCKLTLALGDALPLVTADATQLRQVIMNLITNASESVGNERGTVTITTGTRTCSREMLRATYLRDDLPAGTYAFVEVRDTGSGMDPETQARIFDPFFTSKFSGRGLGLAALLGIVRSHGGAIELESTPGHGTRFRVYLPTCAEAPTTPSVDRAAPGLEQRSGRVLVVDDEEEVRTFARRALQRHGFDVIVAENGERALEVLSECDGDVSVVLLDLLMPELSGEEVFQELQKRYPGTPVVLSSGYTEDDAVPRMTEAGLASFLPKPYRTQALVEAIDRAIGRGS
jgi:signal transduction histidine kinase/CheY-like chemotaxis protein